MKIEKSDTRRQESFRAFVKRMVPGTVFGPPSALQVYLKLRDDKTVVLDTNHLLDLSYFADGEIGNTFVIFPDAKLVLK